jgi:hypothetical protein
MSVVIISPNTVLDLLRVQPRVYAVPWNQPEPTRDGGGGTGGSPLKVWDGTAWRPAGVKVAS